MVELSRVLPILCEFGIGAFLCFLGIRAGLKSGYLDLRLRDNRRLLFIFAGGFVALLSVYCAFTFWLPFVGTEATP